jgi:hypothetical protein
MSWVLRGARAVILSSNSEYFENRLSRDGGNLSPNEEANHGLD